MQEHIKNIYCFPAIWEPLLDVGVTTGGVIVWAVFANMARHTKMLTGRYTVASAEMLIAAGLGANVLVGDRTATSRYSQYQCRAKLDSTSPLASSP